MQADFRIQVSSFMSACSSLGRGGSTAQFFLFPARNILLIEGAKGIKSYRTYVLIPLGG